MAKTGKHLAFITSGARDSSVTTGDQSPLCAHPAWRTGGNAQQSQQRQNSQKQMSQLKPHRRRKCFGGLQLVGALQCSALRHWTAVTCEGPAARSSRTASAPGFSAPSWLLCSHPPLPPLPIPTTSCQVRSSGEGLPRKDPYLLMLPNRSETRRLHVVTPAAQPVVISYRRHTRESVPLAAQSLGPRGSEAPDTPLGPGTAPRPRFLRAAVELSYVRPWGQEQNNGSLSSNFKDQAPAWRDFRAMSSYEVGNPGQGPCRAGGTQGSPPTTTLRPSDRAGDKLAVSPVTHSC